MTETYRCWAEVDLNALRANLREIRRLAGAQTKVLSVVKADAYGHGLRQIAAVLMESGTDIFGVANLAEARAISTVGDGWPVLMLGACLPSEVDSAVRGRVMPTISSLEEARRFSVAARKQNVTVSIHLKVDTGMGRLGLLPDDVPGLLGAIRTLPGLKIAGLYTHFSSAEDDPEFTAQQRQTFVSLVQDLSARGQSFDWIHASNSGGLLLEPTPPCNTVRAGVLVYGIIPSGSRLGFRPDPSGIAHSTKSFQPVLTWRCRVSLVREVPARTPISYGHTFTTLRPTRAAIITAGYGDGFLRAGSNRAQVLVRGRRCPVLGRVTMDQTIVDVTELESVEAGDEVVLLGAQAGEVVTAHELAEWCDTIPWEILTNISYRVPRVYRGSHAA